MGRRVCILVAWLAIISGLATPALAQTVEQDISYLSKAMAGVYIVDDNDSGFKTVSGVATTDWPIADAVCGLQVQFKTSYWQPYHVPLGLGQVDSTQVKLGQPFGTTIHWTAQYKPAPDNYFLDNHAMGTQTTDYHNVAQWIPDLTGTGLGTGCYEVWVYIPWNTTDKAQYTVRDALGASSVIPVRQYGTDKCTSPRNKWVRLDSTNSNKQWKFNGTNTGQWVQLDDQTGETGSNGLNCIVYDAVAFKKVTPASIKVVACCDLNGNCCVDENEKTFIVTDRALDVCLYSDPACTTSIQCCNTDSVGYCVFNTGLTWGTTYYAKVKNGITPSTSCTSYKYTLTDCGQGTIYVPVQCTGSITVYKVNDCNMNGSKDNGESYITGWPVKLTGTKTGGGSITPVYGTTNGSGYYTFSNLEPGTYTITEETNPGSGDQIQWQKLQHGSDYDWTATWKGGKWMSTNPLPNASSPNVPTSGVITVSAGDSKTYTFYNVALTTVTAFKFLDMNLNGKYDTTCDKYKDSLDWWSPDRAFDDGDSDGKFDYPECPINNWPFKLTGKRADGKVITITGTTLANGIAAFDNLPPSDASGYTLSEDVPWKNCGSVQRATYGGAKVSCVSEGCLSDRWQATTPIEQKVVIACSDQNPQQFCFGNVCLTKITGIKMVSDAPRCDELTSRPGAGIKIYLMGKDHLEANVIPSEGPDFTPCKPAGQNPPAPVGHTPVWYESTCNANGYYEFLDLLPGHYHVTEIPLPDHSVVMDPPIYNGCEMACCALCVNICNPRVPPPGEIYQVDLGSSCGTNRIQLGYKGFDGDTIKALPAVLALDPGNNWDNYKKSHGTSVATTNTQITMKKDFDSFWQCADVFKPVHITQSGASNIRRWWPLMYEPPTTTWTLTVSYDTDRAVQLPGESSASTSHSDTWRWTVKTDIPHMIMYLDLLHEVPYGTDEVPLISDEVLYKDLRDRLVRIDTAMRNGRSAEAGAMLKDFELVVMAACITTSPRYPNPTGSGTGIANSDENPACCKLLVDAEYVGRYLGLWTQSE